MKKIQLTIIFSLFTCFYAFNQGNSTPNKQLFEAVANYDTTQIIQLTKNGADINANNKNVASSRYVKRTGYGLKDRFSKPYHLFAINCTNNSFGLEMGWCFNDFFENGSYEPGKNWNSIAGYSPEISAGLYIHPEGNTILEPKISYYAFLLFVQCGGSISYCTNFTDGNLNLRPYCGLTLFSIADLSYGYNFAVTDQTFPEINTHNLQLKVRFR
jgi:hypothetical protein